MRPKEPVNLLLVDDRPENLLALEAILTDPRYRLVKASSGAEALQRVQEEEFALILLDVQMPGLDGFDTAQQIKQLPKQGDVPIIFITAINKDPVHVFRGYESGAIDYITKPLDDHLLRSKVAVIVELYQKNRQIRRQERALIQANAELQKEIQERQHAELALRLAQEELEGRVRKRTEELATANEKLRQEIAERTRIEVALRETEERFRVLVEGVKDYAIIMLDPVGRIMSWNTGAQRILGYQADEILGKNCSMLCDEEDIQDGKPAAELQTALAMGRLEAEGWRVKKDGERFWAHVITAPLYDSAKRFCGFGKVLRDVTEQKRADQRLREALSEKEVLLKEIHHRVKNNLQVICSLLSLQARSVSDPTFLAMFKNSCSRIKSMALIHEKLYQTHDLAHIDMAEYLQQLVIQLKGTYDVSGNISFHVQAEQVLLDIDPAISCALMINELVANAIEHAFPDGRPGEIWIELRSAPSGEYTFIVGDNGIGLPEEFDIHHSPSLGISLVNDLTEQLNGTISLDRTTGSRFIITIPPQAAETNGIGESRHSVDRRRPAHRR